MPGWKPEEKVQVNLSLTIEAAMILKQYAGERNRGAFVSALLVAEWTRDQIEAKRALMVAQKPRRRKRKKGI